MLDAERLGEHSPWRVHEVERGAIAKFARALQLDNPIHFSPERAHAAGYRDVVAPPTFVVTLLPWEIPGLTLPEAGVLHGEQEFEWAAPICAKDEIRVSGWIEGVKTRTGQQGQMTLITVASEGINQAGEIAFRARAVLVVTEEVAHAGG
ncbi:MAG: MaoC family dehydratase [Sulfobacillus acidophilus]|uniref:MaoC family dehydratase n=1 Tax=Sulfobacillus acidophilus TaxID=53633 RepID=A0A2T2WKY0_9FIRM|nr:MAG: MaoC family dehydratase [Sulfobacillus acidophilus]